MAISGQSPARELGSYPALPPAESGYRSQKSPCPAKTCSSPGTTKMLPKFTEFDSYTLYVLNDLAPTSFAHAQKQKQENTSFLHCSTSVSLDFCSDNQTWLRIGPHIIDGSPIQEQVSHRFSSQSCLTTKGQFNDSRNIKHHHVASTINHHQPQSFTIDHHYHEPSTISIHVIPPGSHHLTTSPLP